MTQLIYLDSDWLRAVKNHIYGRFQNSKPAHKNTAIKGAHLRNNLREGGAGGGGMSYVLGPTFVVFDHKKMSFR